MCVDSHAQKKKREEKPNKIRERAQREITSPRPLLSVHLHPSRHTAHEEPPNLRSVVGGSFPYERASL